jgi:hypothetical protein
MVLMAAQPNPLASPAAALAAPAAQLAVAALKVAAVCNAARDLQAAEAVMNIGACIKLAGQLTRSCIPAIIQAINAGSVVTDVTSARYAIDLLCSLHFGQLLLVMLAVQTQQLLQEHFPAQCCLDGSSSRTTNSITVGQTVAAAAPAAPVTMQYHRQLWQDLCFPDALLNQAAVAARKLAPVGSTARSSFEAAMQAAHVLFLLFKASGCGGRPITAVDLSAQQLQLPVMAMRVPLLLMEVAQQAANSLSSSSSTARSRGLDKDCVLIVLEALWFSSGCWRLLGTTSSSHTAESISAVGSSNNARSSGTSSSSYGTGSSSAAASSNASSSGTASSSSQPAKGVLNAQLSECLEILLQQVVKAAHDMLTAPLRADKVPDGVRSDSIQKASSALGTAGSSSRRRGSSSGGGCSGHSDLVLHINSSGGQVLGSKNDRSLTQPCLAAAEFSAWSDRLDVVRGLVKLLSRAAEQQQLHHCQQQADSRSMAEVVQLPQQHLRTVLLPLLASPTAEVSAFMAGGTAWSSFCKVLLELCAAEDGPVVARLLMDAAASATVNSLEQQLFGLVVSLFKVVVYASQLPSVAVVSCEQPAPYSMLRIDTWEGCSRGMSGPMALVMQVIQQQQQQQQQQKEQQQQGALGSNAVPWLLLLVRGMFAGSRLAAAVAAAWPAGQEVGGRAVKMLRWCMVALEHAATCFTQAAAQAAAAAPIAPGSHDVLRQLHSALHNAMMAIEPLAEQEGHDITVSRSTVAAVSAQVQELSQELQQWCLTFCGHFATSCCCNNPACINLASSSEQELVGGKKCVCSRCVTAQYCSRECQEVMWPHHKQNCKALKRQRQQQQQQRRE